MLSLSSLDAVMALDASGQWLAFTLVNGYLSQYVDELLHYNTDLLALLGNNLAVCECIVDTLYLY